MKKKLFSFFLMLACSIGAWATSFTFGSSTPYSSYCTDKGDGTYLLHIGSADDVTGSTSFTDVGMWAQKYSDGAKVVVEVADGVDLTGKGHDDWYWLFQYEKNITVDLSGLNETNANAFKNWDYSWNSNQVNSVIIPTVCSDDIETYAKGILAANVSGINFYGVSSDGTSASAYVTSNTTFNSSILSSSATSLQVLGTAIGDNVISAINNLPASVTNVSINGTMHSGVTFTIDNDNITTLDFSNVEPASGESLSIDVSGCANLTSINMTDANVTSLTVANDYAGTISVNDVDNPGFTITPSIADGGKYTLVGPVLAPVTFSSSLMYLHEAETTGDNPDKFVYWYNGEEQANAVATVNMNDNITLAGVVTDYLTGSYQNVKITGTLSSSDLDALKDIDCQVLDLSEAVISDELLAAKFSTTNALHDNTKFLVAPTTSTRETLVNARSLAGLRNIYSVVAYSENTTATVGNGYNLTSYTRVPGTLQAAVTSAMASAANSWTRNEKSVYTSSVSTFRDVIVSGALNAYDMGGAPSGGLKLDDNGHLAWDTEAVEGSVSDNRTQTGTNTVYGPFSSSFQMTSFDMKEATFESIGDMTISYLGITSSATGKIVISQDPSVKEIPAFFMSSVTDIKAICIPSNIEIIRTRAFYSLDYIWTTSGVNDPEGANTKLDNGATYSQSGDVVYGSTDETLNYRQVCVAGTYTFSSNLKMIETGAFSNATPHVKDVYVLNTVAPECHVDAFNTAMYSGNGGYSPVITDGIITRDSYIKENNQWITMLHYPRETTTPNVQRYTDPTRNYSIATGERDGKGATIYFPNQSEFIRAYQQGTYGYTWNAWNPTRENNAVNNGTLVNTTEAWNAASQAIANDLWESNTKTDSDVKPYTSFYDVTLGGDAQPSGLVEYYQVNWDESSYSTVTTGGNLYPQRNTENTEISETTERDYRGWHQFVLTAYAANTVLEEEPMRSYITDNEWWTICPQFDITRSEAAILYGTMVGVHIASGESVYPFVSKLRYVVRNYINSTIYLNFSQSLTSKKEERENSTDKHGINQTLTGIVSILDQTPDETDIVMSAGVPYLIKPTFPAGSSRQFRFFKNTEERDKFVNQFTSDEWAEVQKKYIIVASESLYNKVKAAQEKSGTDQMADLNAGLYTVPVFVSEGGKDGIEKETVEYGSDGTTPKTYSVVLNGKTSTFHKSADWKYTFVGTFYKSYLPLHSYFLGWNSTKSCAQFYYYDTENTYNKNNMTWANETGVICPTKGDFTYEVSAASEGDPAQWKLQSAFPDDSYKSSSSSETGAKSYSMMFNAPDVWEEESIGIATGVEEIVASGAGKRTGVYTVNGQCVGSSVEGLAKGIYIVNGKKYVVE